MPPSFYIVQLSDLHFGKPYDGPLRLLDLHSGFQGEEQAAVGALSRFLARMDAHGAPYAMAVTGDLTVRGLASEFRDAQRFLDGTATIARIPGTGYNVVPDGLAVIA